VGSEQHVFNHVVIKIRQLFLRPAACLTSTLVETVVSANDWKCNRDQRLNVLSEAQRARDNILVTHPMTDHWKRCLASAIARQAH
jgi:hypothetical protein